MHNRSYYILNKAVRDEAEQYDDTEIGMLVADIMSVDHKGERMLSTIYKQSVASSQIEWEDWKPYIVFTTLLYGGFENEEEVYQAFCEKALPEGKNTFKWDVQLEDGYCTVSYYYSARTILGEDRFAMQKKSALMSVDIYESYELYQELHNSLESCAD